MSLMWDDCRSLGLCYGFSGRLIMGSFDELVMFGHRSILPANYNGKSFRPEVLKRMKLW